MAGTPRIVTVELSQGTSGRVGGNVGCVVGCEPACPVVIKAGRGVWDGQCVAEHCVHRRGLLRPPPPTASMSPAGEPGAALQPMPMLTSQPFSQR